MSALYVKSTLTPYPPAHLGRAISYEAQTKLEPVRDDHAEDVESELACNECATRRVCCYFGTPYGHDSVEVTCANAVDNTSAAHPSELALAGLP